LKGTLVLFAGASKSGKTTLARRLSAERHLPLVTFSATVRRRASERFPGMEQTIELLQNLGLELLQRDPSGFCREVCNQQNLDRKRCKIVDGLRHRSLVPILKALHPECDLRIIYTEASKETRAKRWEQPLSEAQLDAIDNHPVERELSEVREIADLIVSTDRSADESYAEVLSWLELHVPCIKRRHRTRGINVVKGLFRLWIVASVAWILFVFFSLILTPGNTIQIAQKRVSLATKFFSTSHLLPIKCIDIHGVRSVDYFEYRGMCWMPLDSFRSLYPERAASTDADLTVQMYSNEGFPAAEIGWAERLWRIIRAAFSVPLITLVGGLAAFWVGRGFRAFAGRTDSVSENRCENCTKKWSRSGGRIS
jgi:dephospho-CoA kinase